jgi:hypothetical protein
LSHERKASGAEAGDPNRQRGAGAGKDAARLVYTLTGMSQDEAKALGVSESERRLLFRIDSAKVNLAPPDAATRWFRLVSVHLGNGTKAYPAGDNVQACEPWKPPSLFEGLMTPEINKVLAKLGAGFVDGRRYSTASTARGRAAWKAVKEQFPTKSDEQCKRVVSAWEKNGVFQVGEYVDPTERKTATGILSATMIDSNMEQAM